MLEWIVIRIPPLRHHPWVRPAAAAALFILWFAPAAAAHAVLEASVPAHGAVPSAAPERLQLSFNEEVDPVLSTVVLVQDA
ncbi:MAG: copper resistance protein CopC, partial [bacterium]